MRDWEAAAARSPREAAVTTKRIDHEGKRLTVDIVIWRTGAVKVYYQNVALEVPRLRFFAAEIDNKGNSWRPY